MIAQRILAMESLEYVYSLELILQNAKNANLILIAHLGEMIRNSLMYAENHTATEKVIAEIDHPKINQDAKHHSNASIVYLSHLAIKLFAL
jgi:adenosyl cobinamide kinase/adenosyl cobinamide phosphate guanylyltransferase